MNALYQTVFQLIKASVFPEMDENIVISDWEAVFKEMREQSIAVLPYQILQSIKGVKSPVYHEWISLCLQSQAQWVRLMHAQSELIGLLEEHDIPCVILKGASAACYYPHPAYRMMGDVDFLVKRKDRERAAGLLEANGYQLTHDKALSLTGHHFAYHKGGISFELHWKLGIIRDEDEELLRLFESGIDLREWRTVENLRFPMLPAKLNGLVLIFHINQHLRSGLGLRQIVDWMMYVDALPEEVWTDEVRPVLQKTGMERLALTVNAMCGKYLGLRRNLNCSDEIDEACADDLMSYIMDRGNFGRKGGEQEKIATVFFDITDPIRGFRRLQRGGICRWEAARKHAFLRPFAWIYQTGRILRIFIRRKITPAKLLDKHDEGLRQRELIESLGLKVERYIETE